MQVEIKHINGTTITTQEVPNDGYRSQRKAVEQAVSAGANLRGANLRGANLRGANLSGANLSYAKSDMRSVLDSRPAEVGGLLAALRAGQVDGSSYEGECACLVGTIANVAHVPYRELAGLIPDSNRPIERLFLAIREGDTPSNHPIAKIVEGWIIEWQSAHPEVSNVPA